MPGDKSSLWIYFLGRFHGKVSKLRLSFEISKFQDYSLKIKK